MINKELAIKQKLSEVEIEIIESLHYLRNFITLKAYCTHINKKEDLQVLYKRWFNNEKLLQKVWKFDNNDSYIKFWTFPKCTCPKMDNEDRYPIGFYIVNGECPIHGTKNIKGE